jgi:hypothetical protein
LNDVVYTSIGSINSYNEHIQKDNQSLFHIGEKVIEGVYLEENMSSLENVRIVICQDGLEENSFYMGITSKLDASIKKLIKIHIECDVLRVIMKLFAQKCLELVLNSMDEIEGFNYRFAFDVFLTSKLKKENLSQCPSLFYKNSHAKDINFLVSSFFFQEKSPLKSLSTKFGQSIDEKVFNENSNASEFKNAHDTLFELIHSLNNKHNVNSDMEIDLIQTKSCLVPLLRPYQINAVKWMLHKEGFNFSDWNEKKVI